MLADVLDVLSAPWLLFWWGLLCVLGVFLSVSSFRHPSRTCENPAVILAALGAGSAMYAGMLANYRMAFPLEDAGLPSPWQHGYGNASAAVILSIPIAFCWAGFAVKSGSFLLVEWVPSLWMGDHRIVVERTFDQAEAMERQGDLAGAEREYLRALQADPADAAARMRLAELRLRSGRQEEGEAELRRIAESAKEAHARAPVVFRLSDLRRDAGDREEARRILEAFLRSGPPEPYRTHAEERLRALSGVE